MIYGGPRAGGPLTRIPLVPARFRWPLPPYLPWAFAVWAPVLVDDVEPGGAGLLSIFRGPNDPGLCDEWDATGGGNRVYLFDSGGLDPTIVPPGDGVLLAESARVRLVRRTGDDHDRARKSGRPGPTGPARRVGPPGRLAGLRPG
jgi:hypothetical protein